MIFDRTYVRPTDVPSHRLHYTMLLVFWGFWFCCSTLFCGVWVLVFCFCFDRVCLVFGWWVFCLFVLGRGFPWVPPKH